MLLLRPPPVGAPGQLWEAWRERLSGGPPTQRYQSMSYPGYAFLRDHNESFASFAAFDPETPFVSWNHDGVGESIQCQFVSGNYFDVGQVGTAAGRAFHQDEDLTPGAHPVAMISYAFWQNTLGGAPQAVGRQIEVNGVSLTIVGVAPAGFTGLLAGLVPEMW